MRKAFVIVGLGFGDEGKGGCTDYICRREGASLVIRYSGGAQCGHNVVLPDGMRHPFSQFGAGTFAGVPTFLDRHVIIDPLALRNEAEALCKAGIRFCSNILTIHNECIVATPLHAWWGRQLEKKNRHGSCGMGIGVARKYWLDYGDQAIYAKDLPMGTESFCRAFFLKKLFGFRQRLLSDLSLFEDGNIDEFEEAYDRSKSIAFCEWGDLFRTASFPGMHYDNGGPLVFEGSQGILLDQFHGCNPYTTWSEVTPKPALDFCDYLNCCGSFSIAKKVVIGVTRAYMTRHGNGPFPSEANRGSSLSNLVDEGNPYNKWQGSMRFGAFDWLLFRYATNVCHKTGGLDYLAVNCLDEVGDNIEVTDSVIKRGMDHNNLWGGFRQRGSCSRGDFLSSLEGESGARIAILGNGPCFTDKECVHEFSD